MKIIKNIIGFVVAIAVMPAIILTVKDVTELKGVKDVQFELLSEEENEFIITTETYNRLIENKNIINYDIESNYPLITREEMDRATWKINDLENEIYIDENGEKRIIENVGQVTFNGSEGWIGRLQGGETTRFTLSKDHPIYNNYTNNYILSNDLYLIRTHISVELNEFQIAFHEDGNIYIGIPNNELGNQTINEYLSENPLTVTYELLEKINRPVKMYDFSTFKLTFDDNRIRVLFDIDEGYYLWEITDSDRLIPINGQYDLGGVWTVKFYVYKIQQPLIRSLVLLIPLIMISGLLFYLFKLLKIKD